MRILPFTVFVLSSPLLLARGEESPTLPGNLRYIRANPLTAAVPSLATALSNKQPCVLDLRYPQADEAGLSALHGAMAGRSTDTRVYVLVSPETPAAVCDELAALTAPGVFTLGISGSKPVPTVVVKTSAAEDRRAYDALAAGKSLSELAAGRIEKERFDEAALVHEFKSGNTDIEPPLPASPNKTTTATEPGKTPDATALPPRDRVLQRAINLHQALLALRR